VRADLVKWIVVLLALAACFCIVALFWQRIHGLAFGSTAGMCIGIAIFLGDAAILRAGGSFTGQFSNPYPYVALGFAASATVITQIGFVKSRAIEVVPAVNSATILTPLILEVAIYPVSPPASFLALIVLILTGVFLLSTGAAAAASG